MKHASRKTKQKASSREHLLKVHFSLVLLVALSAVIDLHIKLRRTTVVVKEHEKPLMEVMVFRKLGPATPEIHLTASIIVHLYFIGSSSPRLFTENCFTKLMPIHELREFQQHMLNLTALSADDVEEGVYLGRRGEALRRVVLGPRVAVDTLGFFTPHMVARAPFHRCG
jgi:hypothetical protein